jgi:hypothetical protein
MRQVYLGGTLINDIFLGDDRMDDVLQEQSVLPIDWLLVGGGGAGGGGQTQGPYISGGGGAGRYVTSNTILMSPTTINVVIGAGAPVTPLDERSINGEQSTITISGTTYTAPGGGGGGDAYGPRTGKNGGSGGGGGALLTGASGGSNVAGTPIAGSGNNGTFSTSATAAGGGGGAGGNSVDGGSGVAWLDGITYARGGPAGQRAAAAPTELGSGGKGRASFAVGGTGGKNGVFKLRYLGTPQATGGTITESGGYTYHTFTSNGTFTY